ncbi:MAG: hypothetical protein QGI95_02240 [Dehalococcoidales bacterium]|jgi:hypothetical protein|nr:hypothetical protein [Dehalococcoidales bacterium]
MAADGTKESRLTRNSRVDAYLDWSPEGELLIFAAASAAEDPG